MARYDPRLRETYSHDMAGVHKALARLMQADERILELERILRKVHDCVDGDSLRELQEIARQAGVEP